MSHKIKKVPPDKKAADVLVVFIDGAMEHGLLAAVGSLRPHVHITAVLHLTVAPTNVNIMKIVAL